MSLPGICTASLYWQQMHGHFRRADLQNTFFLPHQTYYYWTGTDQRMIHVQFKVSCLESSVCSVLAWSSQKWSYIHTPTLLYLWHSLHCQICSGWMEHQSSILLCPHIEASLEDSNMTCQMRLISATDLCHKLSITSKTWTMQNWAVVNQRSSPFIFVLIHR